MNKGKLSTCSIWNCSLSVTHLLSCPPPHPPPRPSYFSATLRRGLHSCKSFKSSSRKHLFQKTTVLHPTDIWKSNQAALMCSPIWLSYLFVHSLHVNTAYTEYVYITYTQQSISWLSDSTVIEKDKTKDMLATFFTFYFLAFIMCNLFIPEQIVS